MLKSIEGIYRDLPGHGVIDLRSRGIDQADAAQLRWRLQAFAEDWERPDMDVYDDLLTR